VKFARLHGHLVLFIQHDVTFTFSFKVSRFAVRPPPFAITSEKPLLRILLGGLAGLNTTGLGGGGVLLGLLRAADGAHTSNGLLAKIGTVTVLGSLVGNTLVDLAGRGLGAIGDGDQVLAGLLNCG